MHNLKSVCAEDPDFRAALAAEENASEVVSIHAYALSIWNARVSYVMQFIQASFSIFMLSVPLRSQRQHLGANTVSQAFS